MIDKIKNIGSSILNIFLYLFLMYSFLLVADIFNIDIKNASDTTITLLYLFGEIVTIIYFVIRFRKDIRNDIKNFDLKKDFKSNLRIYVISCFAMVIINIIILYGFKLDMANNEEANRLLITKLPLYTFISFLFTTPIIEELTFRMNFKNVFKNDTLYCIIVGIIFGAIHVVFSMENVIDLIYIIPYSALGIGFSTIYRKSHNIVNSVIFHSIHNAICIILILL